MYIVHVLAFNKNAKFFFIIDENWHFAMNAKREGIGKYMETMGKS